MKQLQNETGSLFHSSASYIVWPSLESSMDSKTTGDEWRVFSSRQTEDGTWQGQLREFCLLTHFRVCARPVQKVIATLRRLECTLLCMSARTSCYGCVCAVIVRALLGECRGGGGERWLVESEIYGEQADQTRENGMEQRVVGSSSFVFGKY